MKTYLEKFLAEYEYTENATSELLCAYDRIISYRKSDFEALISEYENSYDTDYDSFMEKIKELSAASDVHEYTGALVLLLCLTKKLREYYHEAGISDEIFRNTVLDLKYKLDECTRFWWPHTASTSREAILRVSGRMCSTPVSSRASFSATESRSASPSAWPPVHAQTL